MKILIYFLAVLSSVSLAEPLTREQLAAQKLFAAEAARDGWTFEYDVRQIGEFKTGYVPPENPKSGVPVYSDGPMKGFDLKDFGVPLTPVLNQGNCGSCVVFAVIAAFQDTMRIKKFEHPMLSPQHLMNCGTGYQCNGAFGEGISEDLVKLKTLHAEKDYPYTATSGRCQTKSAPRHGKIESYKTIDGSVQSILAALRNGQPSAVGVAADNRFMSYKSGRYNGCGSMQTNHYVVIQGVDCETSVDEAGNCKFDAKGNLPPGVGTFLVRNSWGNWGDKGYIRMAITDKSGRRCNNIAGGQGNAQVYEIGVPLPPTDPVKFKITRPGVTLDVEVAPTASYPASEAQKKIEKALTSVGVK